MSGEGKISLDGDTIQPFSFTNSTLYALIFLLLMGLLLAILIMMWEQKQFSKLKNSFSKLKVIHKDLLFLDTIFKQTVLVTKLAGYTATEGIQSDRQIPTSSQQLISNIQTIRNILEQLHNCMDIKIFPFQAQQITDRNIEAHLQGTTSCWNKIMMEIQLNWSKWEGSLVKRFQVLKLFDKKICQLQKVEAKLNSLIENWKLADRQKYDNQFYEQLEDLKKKFCEGRKLQDQEIKHHFELFARIRDCLSDQKQTQISADFSIQILTINAQSKKIQEKQPQITKISHKEDPVNKQAFKKKLDNLLLIGLQQRKQKLEQLEQQAEKEQQLLKAEVSHIPQKSRYEIKNSQEEQLKNSIYEK